VGLEHLRADQVRALELLHLVLAEELELVIDHRAELFLQLLWEVVEEGAPLRSAVQGRNEVRSNAGVLLRYEDQAALRYELEAVDLALGLDACEQLAGILMADF